MDTREVSNRTLNEVSDNALLLNGLNELNILFNAHIEELTKEARETASYFIEKSLNKLSREILGSMETIV